MLEYQLRVVEEKRELDLKLRKLDAFNNGDEFKALPDDEKGRLLHQAEVMQEYSDILASRIAAFPKKK